MSLHLEICQGGSQHNVASEYCRNLDSRRLQYLQLKAFCFSAHLSSGMRSKQNLLSMLSVILLTQLRSRNVSVEMILPPV